MGSMLKPIPTHSYIPTMSQGLVKPGNLNPFKRKPGPAPDGEGFSTTISMSFGNDKGEEILVPTFVDGKSLVQRKKHESDKSYGKRLGQAAIERYQKTGEHFGIYRSIDDVEKAAAELHNAQVNALNLLLTASKRV